MDYIVMGFVNFLFLCWGMLSFDVIIHDEFACVVWPLFV